jgi:DNA polymerase (family 10)
VTSTVAVAVGLRLTASTFMGTEPTCSARPLYDVPMVDRFEVASALREVGAILDALGENRFRARAYARGARAVEGVEDLDALVDEGRLMEVDGIGEALARVIDELVRTGRSGLLERLRQQVPASVLELASLRGLSLDRARALHDALGVTTVPELQAAARAGRVRAVKGFGEKTEAKLLEEIARHHASQDLVRLVDLVGPAHELLEQVRRAPWTLAAELTGALRRFEDAATEAVIVAKTNEPRRVQEHLVGLPHVARVESRDHDRVRVRLGSGLPVELVTAAPEAWAGALLTTTSAPEHLAALEDVARARGLTLDVHTCAWSRVADVGRGDEPQPASGPGEPG